MKPKISIITLGVNDLQKSTEFYQKLGFKKTKKEPEISFFELENITFALFPKDKLAEDAKVPNNGTGLNNFTLAHNVGSEKEVDETLKFVESRGAKIIKPAEKVFWGGYSGYFADLDGFLWEVAYNPFMDLT